VTGIHRFVWNVDARHGIPRQFDADRSRHIVLQSTQDVLQSTQDMVNAAEIWLGAVSDLAK
jgi:hypothetical protein